jgi:TRAP-type mannitol/chloroaromatic compound transport system permease large subunit
VATTEISRGVLPFIGLQLLLLAALLIWPAMATWLPGKL